MRRWNSTAPSRRMPQQADTPQGNSLLGGLTDWSFAVEGDQRTRHIALLLALHVDAQGEAFPSVERLAQLSGMTPRTVESRLQALMEQGAIEDTGRKAGRRGSTRVLRVRNYRPATWQTPREGLPLPVAPVDELSTVEPSTTASEAPTTAVSLTTTVAREPANKGTSLTQEKDEGPTKPSQAIKAKLAEVKARPRSVAFQGPRHYQAHQRPATGSYGPSGGTVGPVIRPAAPQSFESVLSGSLLAALNTRSGPH